MELNDYANYSYLYNGVSQCSFDHVHFLIDDISIYGPGGHGEAVISSFSTLGGISITNCEFANSISFLQLAQNDRERAIYIFSTGINVSNCTFEGFKGGIYSAGYTGIPTRSDVIYNNSFNHITDNIDLAAAEFGDIRSNDITNMYSFSYPSPGGGIGIRPANGIYLDQARGTYVGCGNTVDGVTDGTTTHRWYGIIVNNSEPYSTTVSDNVVTDMLIAFQSQKRNTRLHIFCNQFEDNTFAMSINPFSTNGILNDQGTGCQTTDIRAGNTFISNQKDIYSYLTTPWSYYAGNGPGEVPAWWYGNMSLFYCNTSANSQCGKTFRCYTRWDNQHQVDILSEYNGLVSLGEKETSEGHYAFGQVIRGYNALQDFSGLQTFLEGENDDRSRKLLIPVYLEQGEYGKMGEAINALTLTTNERTAYSNYYGLLETLKQNNRPIDSLTSAELQMVHDLAADSLEVTPYAKGLLEWAYAEAWDHPIEPLPMDEMSHKVLVPETPGVAVSRLMNAVPNPTPGLAAIAVFVGKREAMNNPALVIHDAKGKEVFRRKLSEGDNTVEVNTVGWMPGIYLYSLNCNNRVLETKKLSVVK